MRANATYARKGFRRDDYAKCEMCGQAGIRHVHLMRHAQWPELLSVGRTCASTMSESSVSTARHSRNQHLARHPPLIEAEA